MVKSRRDYRAMKTAKTVATTTSAMAVVQIGLWALLLLTLPYSSWLSLVLKVVLFGVPAYPLSRFVSAVDTRRSLLLERAPSAAWIGLSAAVLVLYALFVDRGQAGLHALSVFFVVSAVVISPLVEEIVFRGVVLQGLTRQLPFVFGNLLTSLLFLLYHIPAWTARNQSISLLGCLWMVVVSLWLGYSLRRSRSLWTCIIIHAVHNLVLAVL